MEEHCKEVLAELSAYLDNECPQHVADVLNQHLADCEPCLDRVDFERELRALVARKCQESAPPGLLDRVVEALESPPPSHTPGSQA